MYNGNGNGAAPMTDNPLVHTSSGIRTLRTMQLRVRIREDGRSVADDERLQFLVTDHEAAEYSCVRPDKKY